MTARNELLDEVVTALQAATSIGCRADAVEVVEALRTSGAEKQPLTDRQREIYDLIVEVRQAVGYSPSTREIQRRFEFRSQSAVMHQLRNLEAKGWIKLSRKISRSAIPI